MPESAQPLLANDAALTSQAISGDRPALELLLRKNWRWLRLLAASLVAPVDTDDVLQNVCIRVLRSIATLREPERLAPWLAAIVRHEALTWLQKQRKRHTLPLPDNLELVGSEQESAAERTGEQEWIRQTVAALPDHYRQVVLLKYMGDYNYAQIAEILDISVSSVQNRLFRARRQIGRLYEQSGFYRKPRGEHEKTRA